jgi:hypothetical protein
MVAEQHKKIKGYRDLSMEEIDLMNRIKEFGPHLQSLIADLRLHLETQDAATVDPDWEDSKLERARLDQADPWRWMLTGTIDLQKGLMALTRAVAQPTFF